MADVQLADPSQWVVVKETRLRALRDSPHAFGSTLSRETRFNGQRWRDRIADGHWLLAWSGGRVVGIAAWITDPDHPAARRLVSMWVEPETRGSTAATDLVETTCHIAETEGATEVTLWVAAHNARARRFYERLGFQATTERQPLPSHPEVEELRMRRRLANRDGRLPSRGA